MAVGVCSSSSTQSSFRSIWFLLKFPDQYARARVMGVTQYLSPAGMKLILRLRPHFSYQYARVRALWGLTFRAGMPAQMLRSLQRTLSVPRDGFNNGSGALIMADVKMSLAQRA
jgi:hypothetical protein